MAERGRRTRRTALKPVSLGDTDKESEASEASEVLIGVGEVLSGLQPSTSDVADDPSLGQQTVSLGTKPKVQVKEDVAGSSMPDRTAIDENFPVRVLGIHSTDDQRREVREDIVRRPRPDSDEVVSGVSQAVGQIMNTAMRDMSDMMTRTMRDVARSLEKATSAISHAPIMHSINRHEMIYPPPLTMPEALGVGGFDREQRKQTFGDPAHDRMGFSRLNKMEEQTQYRGPDHCMDSYEVHRKTKGQKMGKPPHDYSDKENRFSMISGRESHNRQHNSRRQMFTDESSDSDGSETSCSAFGYVNNYNAHHGRRIE